MRGLTAEERWHLVQVASPVVHVVDDLSGAYELVVQRLVEQGRAEVHALPDGGRLAVVTERGRLALRVCPAA